MKSMQDVDRVFSAVSNRVGMLYHQAQLYRDNLQTARVKLEVGHRQDTVMATIPNDVIT
jgi:hypothetical protein